MPTYQELLQKNMKQQVISKPENLKKLSLNYNQLTSLPSEISELKNLEILVVSYNPLDFQNYKTIEICGEKVPVS